MKVPFAKVFIGESERRYLSEVLESGWLTTASKTLEFEKRFSEYVGAKYACAVNSCTAALHLAVDALGVTAGSKVFVPSMTFTATAEVVRYMSADPVFLDTEYGTNLITPQILNEAIRLHPDVRYLMVVHYGGQSAKMDELLSICKENDIKIIEDAAHAFPSRFKGKMIGSFGDITCFSFYANKTITTGEGGMLVTDDENIYKRVKTMRLHGINRDIWDRFTSKTPSWEYDVVEAGYKYNLPDLAAAIGLGQLEQAELLRSERQRCVMYYYENLKDIESLDLPICNVPLEDHAWHLFPVVLNEKSRISRNEIIDELSMRGVGTSVHYKPIHELTYYKNKYNLEREKFPNTSKTWQGNFSLPLYAYMSEEELRYVCSNISELLK